MRAITLYDSAEHFLVRAAKNELVPRRRRAIGSDAKPSCPAPPAGHTILAVPELIAAFDAFPQEQRRCGELEGGVERELVWMACTGGAEVRTRTRIDEADTA
jgi:hypothetical protein